jgi:alanine racemase
MKQLVVECQLVKNNAEVVKKLCENKVIYGVLKGDGYGLGLLELAKILRDSGISSFAVTEPSDALALREAGYIDEDILIMRSTSIEQEVEQIVACRATATIGSDEAAVALNGIAGREGTIANVHIKIDTGMGRYGFLPDEGAKILSIYKYMQNLNITGTYTHLNRSYSSKRYVDEQMRLFKGVLDEITAAGEDPGLVHAANSSAILRYPETHLGAVRAGSVFLGRVGVKGDYKLKKVGHAREQIVDIRWLKKGCTVGYGAKYRCKKMRRIAVVPLGYAHGFALEKAREIHDFSDFMAVSLSAFARLLGRRRHYALLNGKRVPVLGRIGTQHTILDVTDCEARVGDYAQFEINPVVAGRLIPRVYV